MNFENVCFSSNFRRFSFIYFDLQVLIDAVFLLQIVKRVKRKDSKQSLGCKYHLKKKHNENAPQNEPNKGREENALLNLVLRLSIKKNDDRHTET